MEISITINKDGKRPTTKAVLNVLDKHFKSYRACLSNNGSKSLIEVKISGEEDKVDEKAELSILESLLYMVSGVVSISLSN